MVVVPFPILISREGKWFIASCPLLDIATQGKTENEVKENMKELIEEYMKDKDTPKPEIKTIMTASIAITNIPIRMKGVHHIKASPPTPA